MSGLRSSQVDVLRHLDALEGEATIAELASRLDRSERSTEQRIERLHDLGLVSSFYRGPSWDCRVFVEFTAAGKQALEGQR
jgi:predicted transcriptional regulator